LIVALIVVELPETMGLAAATTVTDVVPACRPHDANTSIGASKVKRGKLESILNKKLVRSG
jgi:hypothetical protein